MTPKNIIVSRVALAYSILLFLGSRNQIGRTIWVLLNLRDTLRALKDVYPNGRRIGVVTRRRRLRAALAGWIVLVTVQPITFAADTLLSWIPFYSSVKMLLVLALSFWRLESSAFLFQTLVVPFVRRYETHIDLSLLLFGSTVLFFFHFLVELPWKGLVALAKRRSRPVATPRTPLREPPVHSLITPPPSPPRPLRHVSPSPEPSIIVESPKGPRRKSASRTSPVRPPTSRVTDADAPQPAPGGKTAASSTRTGYVKAAAQALEASSVASASDRERPRPTTSGRPKRSEAPSRASSSRAESSRPVKTVRPSNKATEARPVRPAPSTKSTAPRTAATRTAAHSARVRAALQTLPPAPSHDPQDTKGTSQLRKSDTATSSTLSTPSEPKRQPRGQKRTRPDDDEYQDSEASTTRSTHRMSTRSTPRKAVKDPKKPAAPSPAKRAKTTREPASKRTRAAATTAKSAKPDSPRVKRARTSKK